MRAPCIPRGDSVPLPKPAGGYQLWVELGDRLDAIELHRQAIKHGISIAPGPIFSARREFQHAIRLNFGHPWTIRPERAVQTLGQLIDAQLQQAR